jgi:RNA polymerase sigma-70 factor (ECF subfamily)
MVALALALRPDHPALAAAVDGEVEALAARKLGEGRAAWAPLGIDEAAFTAVTARYLGRTVAVAARLPLALAAADGAELACAAACATGDLAAAQAIEARYFPAARGALGRMSLPAPVADGALQRLREKLFLPIDGRPGLERFIGAGRLAAFVRVAVVREAIDLLRQDARAPALSDDGVVDLLAPLLDPEAAAISADLRSRFRAAFEAAVAALAPRQRACLRLHVLDGVTLDELALTYGVHRATVARWLEAARDALAEGTRAHLRRDLDLGDADVDSVVRQVQSQVELSFARILGA